MENVWNEIENTRLKLLGDVKLTPKAKLLTRFCLLLQPYLIFQPLSIFYGFPDLLFHFFTIYFAIFHHGSQSLTSSYLLLLSIVIALPPYQNFGSCFLCFGKCGVIPYCLDLDSLTLRFWLFLALLANLFVRWNRRNSSRNCAHMKKGSLLVLSGGSWGSLKRQLDYSIKVKFCNQSNATLLSWLLLGLMS